MAWPSAATKVHMDEGSDDPKQARVELADLVDQFNTLRSHFSSFMQTFVAQTTAAAARGDIGAQQAINALTEETAPAVGDFLGLRDTSAGADRKMTLANALKVINGLNELTTVDGAADFLPIFDLSAGTAKKVKPDNLGGVFSESFTSAEQTITSGGSLTIAHGLSGLPTLSQVVLVCRTAELGYSIGNRLVMGSHAIHGDANGQAVVLDSSNIFIRYGAEPEVYDIIRKDNGQRASITPGSWRLVVRAWR